MPDLKPTYLRLFSLLIVVLAVGQSESVQAAVLGRAFYGCRTQADEQKLVEALSKGDSAGVEKLAKPMVVSGSCITIGRGIDVSIDEKKLTYLCVRLPGALECYWVADALINQKPHEAEERHVKPLSSGSSDSLSSTGRFGNSAAGSGLGAGSGGNVHGFSTDLLSGNH